MAMFNDADDFFETSAAAGNAMRFKDVDGIGPKTASKITSIRGVRNPDDVAEMSADELSDKAGISTSRASKAIKAGGGNPSVSKQGNIGTVSAAGMIVPVGDFKVKASDPDKARAKNDARSRSREAVRQDDRKRAPVTTDFGKWKNNKSKYDFPGVDTPTQNPDLLPKDLKAGSPRTNNFEARDKREAEEKRQSYPRKTSDARGNENAILETGDDRIPAGEETAQAKGVDPFGVFLEARDVSLDPDEAFNATGAIGISALGGLDSADHRDYNERAPKREPKAPPERALRRQQRKADEGIAGDDSDAAGIVFIFENTDTDMGLDEFRRRTKRVGREIGMSDGFGNAQMVANDPDILSKL